MKKFIAFLTFQCLFLMSVTNLMGMRKIDDDFGVNINDEKSIIVTDDVEFETDYDNYAIIKSSEHSVENIANGIVF